MIRILPMDRVGKFDDMDIEDVQKGFFLSDLSYESNGKYMYGDRGIDAPEGTIILFQYDNSIIASAKFIKAEKFLQPVYDEAYGVYKGAYYFDPASIVVFDPISSNEIESVWSKDFVDSDGKKRSGFKRFSNAKRFLNPAGYPRFLKLLTSKGRVVCTPPTLGKYGKGGEGEAHKTLKLWLSDNPDKLGLKDVIKVEVERRFLSGDTADIVFSHKKNRYTVVEVETNNPMPGAHQAIKYRALLCAEKQFSLDSAKVSAILVAWAIPKNVRIFCKNYSIGYQVHKK
jgi:hypothetical protein